MKVVEADGSAGNERKSSPISYAMSAGPKFHERNQVQFDRRFVCVCDNGICRICIEHHSLSCFGLQHRRELADRETRVGWSNLVQFRVIERSFSWATYTPLASVN